MGAKDDTGVSLMVWNYQGTDTKDYNTAVNVANLPSIFNGKNVRVKTYKIDATTSNYYASPDNSNLQMVDDKIVPHNGDYTASVQLEPNSLQLLVLEPVSKNVFLTNSFDDEVTGADPGWTVTEPAGTAVSIANEPDTVNRSVYLYNNSSIDYAGISKSFTAQSSTITAQWRFKGDSGLTNNRFQLKYRDTVAADVYVNTDNVLVGNGTPILGLNTSIWYDVKLTANPATDKYDIYVNDSLKAAGILYSAPVAALDTISFRTGDADRNRLYIDDVAVYDITPPSWNDSKNLISTERGRSSIGLSWSGADDTAVSYNIYNETALSQTVTGTTYATIAGLIPGRTYTFTVQAVDAYGNASTDGPALTVSTASSRRGGSVSGGGGASPGETVSNTGLTAGADGKVDPDSLTSALSASIHVEIKANGDSVSLPATGLIDASKNQSSTVKVTSANGSFVLPLSVLKLEELAKSTGTSLSDLYINLSIKKVSGDTAKEVSDAVSNANAASLSDAVDFSVTAQGKDGHSVDVSFGSTYVSRSVDVLKTVDPGKTTGALYNEATQSLTFVPSIFESKDGKTVATLKRNGNSIYTVVELNRSFDDIAAHWAKADIELLANKLVIDGVSERKFDADRNITRAEFAALIVRALGLSSKKISLLLCGCKG